jgi:hypothetical protein
MTTMLTQYGGWGAPNQWPTPTCSGTRLHLAPASAQVMSLLMCASERSLSLVSGCSQKWELSFEFNLLVLYSSVSVNYFPTKKF